MATPTAREDGERDALDALLDRLNVFDALDAMLFACCAGYRDARGEHVTRVPSVLVEYVWARLLRRRTFDPPVPAETPVRVEELVAHAFGALHAELQDLPPAAADGDPTGMEHDLRTRLNTQGLWAYDPWIPHLELERTTQLLGPFQREIARATGAPLASLASLHGVLFRERYEWLLASVGVPGLDVVGSIEEAHVRIRRAAAEGARETILPGSGLAGVTTLRALAAAASVPPTHVERFCELLAGAAPGDVARLPFRQLVWRLRRRPVARWGPFVVLPVPVHLAAAFRPAIETALRRDRAVGRRYDYAKGRWLEARTIELLQSLLPVEEGYRALHVRTPGGSRAERDALLCVDFCGLAIEVKGVGIPPSAREGDVGAQDRLVERLVLRSARQAETLAAAVRAGDEVTGVRLEDGRRTSLDLRGVARWIPLVVTLEDIGGVAAASRAVFGRRGDGELVPVVLSIDDLAWYGEALRLPAALLHYFVVRTRIARSSARIVVVDEADWFRMYLHGGGAAVQEMLDGLADLPTQIVPWVSDARRGITDPRAPVWRTPHEQLLRRWQDEAIPGWLDASFALLDLSVEQSAMLAEGLRDALAGVVLDEDVALVTLRPAGEPQTAVHVLASVARRGTIDMDDLAPYLMAQAPDASRRVVLGTRDGVVDNLHVLGVGRIETAVDPASETPSS